MADDTIQRAIDAVVANLSRTLRTRMLYLCDLVAQRYVGESLTEDERHHATALPYLRADDAPYRIANNNFPVGATTDDAQVSAGGAQPEIVLPTWAEPHPGEGHGYYVYTGVRTALEAVKARIEAIEERLHLLEVAAVQQRGQIASLTAWRKDLEGRFGATTRYSADEVVRLGARIYALETKGDKP